MEVTLVGAGVPSVHCPLLHLRDLMETQRNPNTQEKPSEITFSSQPALIIELFYSYTKKQSSPVRNFPGLRARLEDQDC